MFLDVGELTYKRWRTDIRRWRNDFIRWRTGRWRTDTLAKRPVFKELPPGIPEDNSFDALNNQVLKVITSLNPMAGFNAGETKTTDTISIFCFSLI